MVTIMLIMTMLIMTMPTTSTDLLTLSANGPGSGRPPGRLSLGFCS
jgi:hypothetical protein